LLPDGADMTIQVEDVEQGAPRKHLIFNTVFFFTTSEASWQASGARSGEMLIIPFASASTTSPGLIEIVPIRTGMLIRPYAFFFALLGLMSRQKTG
jgi:hypothetical protein